MFSDAGSDENGLNLGEAEAGGDHLGCEVAPVTVGLHWLDRLSDSRGRPL